MPIMELDILSQALRLRNRGLSVFPVSVETKQPAVSWDRYQDQLPTEQQIRNDFAYAEEKYGSCAVGVATGPVSNIFLLDLDFKHPEAKEYYEANRHRIPRTWSEQTSGGLHFYFKWCDELNARKTHTASKIHRGVDSRGQGGYVKITPSPGYKWILSPEVATLAMCPKWLIESLPLREPKVIPSSFIPKPQDWILADLNSIVDGDPVKGRTPTFLRVIGSLKDRRLSEAEIAAFLSSWVKQHHYEDRINGLIADQFVRYPAKPEIQAPKILNHSLKAAMVKKKTIPFIVPGIVGENTINVWAGLQESRKSWLLLDLAVSIASGTPWLGRYQCSRGKVIILDQERPGDEMMRRLEALWTGRGLTENDLEGNLSTQFDLDPKFMLNHEESFAAFEKMVAEFRPSIVLMDSLSAIQSGDIMSKADMQKLFERIKTLRLRYKTAFVILHHENKGTYEAMREKKIVTAEHIEGSGVINQVPEGLFVIRDFDGDSSMLHHVKNSYGTKVPPFLVKIVDLTPDRKNIAVQAF